MTYLDYFHFDKEPFPTTTFNNYIYENKRQFKIIDDIVNSIRFNSGIYSIIGSEGVGKTFVLRQIQQNLKNNDIVVFISANENLDILKTINDQITFASKKQNVEDVFQIISKYHKKGQNIIFLIDNMQNLDKKQITNLTALIDVLPYLKIVATGDKSLKKLFNNKKYKILKTKMVKQYKLSYLSFTKAMKYINSISVDALSLSQYKKVIGFLPRAFISYISNRNIKNINFITTEAIKKAYENKNKVVKIKDVYDVAKTNFHIVKENIYLKFQKIFFWILVVLSMYFCFKLFADRNYLLQKMEVEKSLDKQEKSFEKLH